MPAYVETWNPAAPAGGDDISLGDDTIRRHMRAITERLGEDHEFQTDETGNNKIGYHKKCTLTVRSSDPTAVTDCGILFTKNVGGGQIELFYEDQAGNVAQLTNLGSVKKLSKEVVMWFGSIATIPTGFYLCNGSGGRPDLRDQFIVGARQDDSGVAKTNVEGSLAQSAVPTHSHTGSTGNTTLTTAQIPSHTHRTPAGQNGGGALAGSQRWTSSSETYGTSGDSEATGGGQSHNHTISASTSIPPYFALAFITQYNA